MATNPYVNKVQFGNQTVMDISDTDAQESDVAAGKTFYKGTGQRSTGTADYEPKYVKVGNLYKATSTVLKTINSTNTYTTTADGVLIGEASIKYSTAKTQPVLIRMATTDSGSRSNTIAEANVDALAGNRNLTLTIGSSSYKTGLFIPKGTKLSCYYYASQSGGTPTAAIDFKLYEPEVET